MDILLTRRIPGKSGGVFFRCKLGLVDIVNGIKKKIKIKEKLKGDREVMIILPFLEKSAFHNFGVDHFQLVSFLFKINT